MPPFQIFCGTKAGRMNTVSIPYPPRYLFRGFKKQLLIIFVLSHTVRENWSFVLYYLTVLILTVHHITDIAHLLENATATPSLHAHLMKYNREAGFGGHHSCRDYLTSVRRLVSGNLPSNQWLIF